ncbi:hypothetical protein ABTX77_42335 [Streptomyces sp. NPDC097704]|uniref:hypothetical protein n=1 Tax=Streptomyces sp. NPDC097704 TaxID=3157101 RepID=UPI00332DE9AC
MTVRTLKRRIGAITTVLGLGVALPFAVGVTPAYAQSQLTITKSHNGNFVRGGQGVYRITVVNNGNEATAGGTRMTDLYPQGLTVVGFQIISASPGVTYACSTLSSGNQSQCDTNPLQPGASYTVEATVSVAADAPCTVSNTASVIDLGSIDGDTVSDPTVIPGPGCNGGGSGGGGSLLPISLSGLIPMFNNITTNSNINSPGAANNSTQNFAVNPS